MALQLYGLYLFLAVYAAGNMVTLQIQHYGIYPFVGKEAFRAYMQANNKAALLPSILPDSFPTVVLEAMATGLPIVATKSGGAEEMIDDGETGFLIEIQSERQRTAFPLDKVLFNGQAQLEQFPIFAHL